jgi:metal-sulfur cluster biosynthetic enzyme
MTENTTADPVVSTDAAPETPETPEAPAGPAGPAATEGAGVATELTAEQEDVLEALRDVVDPELGINVVDLGLIYGVDVDAERIATIDMTLTSAACPLTDVIEDQAREALDGVVADFRINWVWMPPWGPESITDDGREQLRALGFNI